MQRDVNSLGTTVMILALQALAVATPVLSPALVGAYVTRMGFSPQQAGYLISAEIAGAFLAAIPALWWVSRLSWQQVTRFSLWLMVAGNLLTAALDSYGPIFATRFVVGLAAGSFVAVSVASIALTRSPERVFGFALIGNSLLGAIGLALFPHVMALGGLAGVFAVLAALALLASLFAGRLPVGGAAARAAAHSPSATIKNGLVYASCGVLGVLSFFIAYGGTWSYLERLGVSYGLDTKFISYCLSLALLASVPGASAASALGNRLGRLVPSIVGFAVILAALTMFLDHLTDTGYMAAIFVFLLGVCFTVPYLLGAVAAVDPSGRAVMLANAMINAGLAIGPTIAASLIGSSGGYRPVTWTGLCFMVLCWVLFLPLVTHKLLQGVTAAPAASAAGRQA